MIKINVLRDNIIDLSGEKEYSKVFDVSSFSDSGKNVPFYVDLISNNSIHIEKFDISSIRVTIDASKILKDEYIKFVNIKNEILVLTVKPNHYFTSERTYKFKITKSEFRENGDLRLRILSKANGEDIGWECSYDGKPILYDIKPRQSNKSCYVTVKLRMNMANECISLLEFKQNESNNIAKINIKNTPNGMEKAD